MSKPKIRLLDNIQPSVLRKFNQDSDYLARRYKAEGHALEHDAVVVDIVKMCLCNGWPATATDSSLVYGKQVGDNNSGILLGWPDITGCISPTGRMWAIEVKIGNRKNGTKSQFKTRRLIRDAGGAIQIVESCEQAQRWLKRLHELEIERYKRGLGTEFPNFGFRPPPVPPLVVDLEKEERLNGTG